MTAWWVPLISLVAGSLLSTATSYFLDRVRRRQQRRDKLDEAKRAALAQALAWIDPMERVLTAAEIEIYGVLNGARDDDEFRKHFPNLLVDLKKYDLSMDQRLVLEGDPYPIGNHICKAVEDLKHQAIDWWSTTTYKEGGASQGAIEARYATTQRVKELRQQVDSLRRQLADEYRKTYN
jgi:hypothetical protein